MLHISSAFSSAWSQQYSCQTLLISVRVCFALMQVGDDSYVIMDLKAFEASGGFEESDEPCELCGEAHQTDANLLLECERCLRGFHMRCVTPPLCHVPEVSRAARLPSTHSKPYSTPALHLSAPQVYH